VASAAAVRPSGLLWLASLLLVALPGAPVLTHRAFARVPASGRVVLAGAAGAALTSFAMTVFALCGVPWSLPAVIGFALLLGFLLRPALGTGGVETRTAHPDAARGVVVAASAVSIVAVAAAFLATLAGAASSPDLLFFWGPKAQRFAVAHTVDAGYLAEPALRYMHPYYPPLVTNLYALASMAAGRLSWTAATLLFPTLLAALAIGLPGILRTLPGARPAVAAATSALVIAALAYIGMEADVGGNAEMPLLVFETLAVAVLLSPLASTAAGQLLAGILLAGAATAKVEGLPFALTAIAVFLWARRRDVRPVSGLLRLAGPLAASLLAWFAYGEKTRLFHGYSGEGALLAPHPEHLAAAVRAIAASLASTGHALPWLIPLACLLAVASRLGRDAAVPLVTAAGLAAFLLFTYLDRPGDPSQWIAWSAPRVFSPLPMLFALAATTARGDRASDG
jgi:hypothetical protein